MVRSKRILFVSCNGLKQVRSNLRETINFFRPEVNLFAPFFSMNTTYSNHISVNELVQIFVYYSFDMDKEL